MNTLPPPNPLPPPKAILFDLLTALLDSWTLWDAAVSTSTTNPDISTTTSSTATTPITSHQWRTHYLTLTFSTGAYTPYEDLLHLSASDVGLPPSVPETLLSNWHKLRPWPEVPRVLARLRKQFPGVKLGVVTNCSRELGRQAADRVCEGLRESGEEGGGGFRFDAVVTAEEIGWYKPRPEAYEAGIKALGVGVEDVVFVAGSAGDVGGARRAGMRVFWCNHVGLELEGEERPEGEGRDLEGALRGVLPVREV